MGHRLVLSLGLFGLFCQLGCVTAVGVALQPPLGWSTWNTFRYNVSEELLKTSALAMTQNGLLDAGYDYVLIDDGWPACLQYKSNGGCIQPAPRDANNRIVVDSNKFPNGLAALAEYMHSLGLKLGIYTAVSKTTCGGFTGSLGYEEVDGATFAAWGMDFVKHDTCNYDCGVHDGCLQNSTALMAQALNQSARPIVYYIDSGNPSSPQRLWNPFQRATPPQNVIKVAEQVDELAWIWARAVADMWKSWFDINDSWQSTLDNMHHQVADVMYQSCGAFNTPDMLTVGMGAQTAGEYRVQFFVWAVLGAPLIIGCDIRTLTPAEVALLTAPEILEVDQDPDCVQGSLVRDSGDTEVWLKPLHDGSFACALVNKGIFPRNITVVLNGDYNGGDFWPAYVGTATIRDLWLRKDLGTASNFYSHYVPGHDAAILLITPSS